MKLALLLLVAFVCARCSAGEYWSQKASNVCFAAKGNKPAEFPVFTRFLSSAIAEVKLVHKSGSVKCASSSDPSNWGCTYYTLKKRQVNVFLTDDNNNILLPRNRYVDYTGRSGYWYTLAGFKHNSKEIVFTDYANPLQFPQGTTKLRIWYGEDLLDYTEPSNSGQVCVDVFFHYI